MDLVVEHLSVRRAGRLVLSDLSFTVRAGEVVELRGANGVGKSTLLRTLAGLLPPLSGTVRLGDCRLDRDRDGFRDRVAYQGHLDAVKPALTVAEALGVWSALLESAPGRRDAALRRLGLGPIAARPGAQCSAGQRRRLGLARLLLADRALWVLDEPTAALDGQGAALVAELIGGHCRAGGVVIAATHVPLGLDGARTLRLVPPREAVAAASDPFLEGGWT